MGRKEDDRHGKWICNYDYRSLETIAKWETVAKPQVISGGKRNDKKKQKTNGGLMVSFVDTAAVLDSHELLT